MLELVLAASGTALATGLGAIPVFVLGERAARLTPGLLGIAAGTMAVASVEGLLLPGLDSGTGLEVGAGVAAGVAFLVGARAVLGTDRHVSRRSASVRTSILVFTVLLVHSLPEGFAIGTAYASDTAGLSLFVIIAIAVQNIPEGTSVAIPMAAAGYGAARQFWVAVLTSIPQPIGAVIAFLLVEEITALLPISFGFAAGAMLALVAIELAPRAFGENARFAAVGTLAGAVAMFALSRALGV